MRCITSYVVNLEDVQLLSRQMPKTPRQSRGSLMTMVETALAALVRTENAYKHSILPPPSKGIR